MNNEKFEMTTTGTATSDIANIYTENEECAKIRFTSTESTATLFNAVNGSGKSIKELLDKEPIKVVNMVVTTVKVHVKKDDESSPIIQRACVHFFTDDNKHYSSLSNGIVRSAASLLEIGLVPTPDTPFTLAFSTAETKKGTAYIFELI